MRVVARHYATGAPLEIDCEAGSIASVRGADDCRALPARWVAPAFFDLQINGCEGRSFSSERLTVSDIRHVVHVCRRHGIAGFCPTFVTNTLPALLHSLATARQGCESDADVDAAIPVFHLEGPYISAEDGPRGAHARQHVRRPDWGEFCRLQEAAGGRIRLVTLAPELDGALRFIERLSVSGVVVAIGHTAAGVGTIHDAIRAGARLSTHLGNGCHAFLPRHQNYLWEQLAADDLWASLITDGQHLPPSLVQCFVRAKTPARTIVTCDASSLAGLPPGKYREWDQELEVLPQGKVIVADSGFLAGSWSFTDTCVRTVIRFAGVTPCEAMDMAGARPRELLGLAPRKLEPGYPADLIVYETLNGEEVRFVASVIAGQTVEMADASLCEVE